MIGRTETGQEIKGSLGLSTEGKDSTGEKKQTLTQGIPGLGNPLGKMKLHNI